MMSGFVVLQEDTAIVHRTAAAAAAAAAPAPAPSSPGRVLLVVESTAAGTGRHVLDLAEGLSARGAEVHLLYSPLRVDGIFASRLARLGGVRRVALPMRRSIHLPSDFSAVRAIRRYLREHGPFDVLHGHSSKGGALARLAALGTNLPAVVYTPHGIVLHEPGLSRLKRLTYRVIEVALSGWTSRVIAVSPEERRVAERAGIAPGRLAVVPNGVRSMPAPPSRGEARRAAGLADEAFVFGSVGRLVDGKAVDVLIDAFARMAARVPAAVLAIVGAGPAETSLRRRAERLGVGRRIAWLGERDAASVYPAFDVFAIASRKEGLPYVVLEALAAGLPVIATDSAGVEILVEDGVSGAVVPRDDAAALADAMAGLATDPALVARYGLAARARASRFTVDAMVDGVARQYAAVAAGCRSRPRRLNVQVVRGDAARRLLADSGFLDRWAALYGQCPWATAFQTHGYATAWYSTYLGVFEPLLLISRAARANAPLQGLLALAVSSRDGSVLVAGRQQAEYHTWLCTPELAGRFPLDALRALRHAIPRASVTFHYLAPGTPIAWLHDPEARRLCLIRPHRRPLLKFGDGREILQSLKKSSNKSRLKRLDKLGGLAFRCVSDPAEFEQLFDPIVRLYDFRHGAVQGSDPFCTLERQKAFHVAMMKVPGLLHVTVMTVGGRLAAAHWGAAGRPELQLGTIVHDPFLAKHSPGKFQILLLSRMLIEQGYEQFDLTPGGDAYKERFTNAEDQVHTLAVLSSPAARARERLVWRAKDLTKTALRRIGLTTTQARFLLRRFRRRPGEFLSDLLRRARSWTASRQETRVYARDARRLPAMRPRRVRRDALDDLLAYDAERAGESRQAFLGDALARIERGEHVYTNLDDGGRLRAYAWVDEQPDAATWGGTPGVLVTNVRRCDGRRGGTGTSEEVWDDLLETVLHDFDTAPAATTVLLEATGEEPGLWSAAERLGFAHLRSNVSVTRFGKTRTRRSDGTVSALTPARPESPAGPRATGDELKVLETTPAL